MMLNLVTDFGDVDLTLTPSGGLGGFEEWSGQAIVVEIADGLSVRVTSLDDIIESKQPPTVPRTRWRCPTWNHCAMNFAVTEAEVEHPTPRRNCEHTDRHVGF